MKKMMKLLPPIILVVLVSLLAFSVYAFLKEREIKFSGYITEGDFDVYSDVECTVPLGSFVFDAFNVQESNHQQNIEFYIKSTGMSTQNIVWRTLTDNWLIQDKSYYYSTDGNWIAKLYWYSDENGYTDGADPDHTLLQPYYEFVTFMPNSTVKLTFSLTANIGSQGSCEIGLIFRSEVAG